jgi:hypothetical protein
MRQNKNIAEYDRRTYAELEARRRRGPKPTVMIFKALPPNTSVDREMPIAERCKATLQDLKALKSKLATEQAAHYAKRADEAVKAAHKLLNSTELNGMQIAALSFVLDELAEKVGAAGGTP